MTKRIRKPIALICAVFLITALCAGFASASADDADRTEIPLYLNGELIGVGCKIGPVTYVPIRAFSEAMGQTVEVSWDGETRTAQVSMPGLDIQASQGASYITANGRCLYVPYGVHNLGGSIAVPIRELAKAFGVGIYWDAETWSVTIDNAYMQLIEPGDSFYDEDDLYWLSRLIFSESGNQPLEGKIGVGNVVLNRVSDPTCPDSVYGVIFDNRYGVQFHVTTSGAIYREPSEEAVVAAKLAMEGCELVGDSLYFVNPEIGVTGWFESNLTYVATIGDHAFYA